VSEATNEPETEPSEEESEKLSELQWRIYGVINEWVRFADAKAGVLLAMDGVLLAAGIGALKDYLKYLKPNPLLLGLVIAAAVALLFSAALCLVCVYPATRKPGLHSLIYFGDIADSRTPDQYFADVLRLRDPAERFREISRQVKINAHIAAAKYRQFNWAAHAFVASLFFGLCALLVAWRLR
jgi:hypothetical protein